eukprot:Sdes_comp19876_c0_seq1m12173
MFHKNQTLFSTLKYFYSTSKASNPIPKTSIHPKLVNDTKTLRNFLPSSSSSSLPLEIPLPSSIPYLPHNSAQNQPHLRPKVFFETYGCQMNVNDTEIVWGILKAAGYRKAEDVSTSDIILIMTCAIRENAEQKIWSRLDNFKSMKTKRQELLRRIQKRPGLYSDEDKSLGNIRVGILGCMAERLKQKLLESDKMVDLVAGPDSYRDLPRMLDRIQSGHTAVNVQLSLEETYADISPVRLNDDCISAYVSIMRGCDNMCSYCIVPFTRGRERSRPISSIVREVRQLAAQGVKEVVLLGQNVNSYRDISDTEQVHLQEAETVLVDGFKTIYKPKKGGKRFHDLLQEVAQVDPEIRIRFTSPHPKDFSDQVLNVIQSHPNICKNIHMPAQSGSSSVLENMRRGYTREAYLDLVKNIRQKLGPQVTLSSDFIVGFCGESEQDHLQTLSLVQDVKFDMAYMFAYSMREKTHAHRRLKDDVEEPIKQQRLAQLISLFYDQVSQSMKRFLHTHQLVLVDGTSRRSLHEFIGRTDGNIKIVFPDPKMNVTPGDYVVVQVQEANGVTLRGVCTHKTTLQQYNTNLPLIASQ